MTNNGSALAGTAVIGAFQRVRRGARSEWQMTSASAESLSS
jgi:hypothetical protein